MMFPADLLKTHVQQGVRLSLINPGSREIALPLNVTLDTVTALRGTNIAVLGGDALTTANGQLEYTGDNWHCAKRESEDLAAFAERSLDAAAAYVSLFGAEEKILFVLVLEGDDQISA